jgi:mRNA-degrading endonuclease RelE of RelBE toxin-antitoxin system
MNYEIISTDDFSRNLKRLNKKYVSIPDVYANFLEKLRANPKLGDDLGNNTRKVRMAITSKNKGKRGGARVITYHLYIDEVNKSR